jgi:Tol biopolymer transport system component
MALFAMSLDTGIKQQITFPKPGKIDCMPAISPDGRNLGFARLNASGVGILLAMPLAAALKAKDETPTIRLIPSADQIFCWNWTYDGHDLLVSRMVAGKAHLWRYPFTAKIGSSPPARVAGLEDEVTQTSISRVNGRLIYTGQVSRNVGVWSYRLRMADAGKRLIASAKMDVDARYSPDGKNIVFASMRAGFGQVDLWMCASDGSNQRQIVMFDEPGEHAVGSPSWSPDGRWIAFDADLPGKTKAIYVMDILGGKPRRLTSAAGSEDSVPSWSRDGHWIYCSSYRGSRHDIWKLPVGGGPPAQVTHDGGFESYESPDGKFLYYTRIGKSGIWRMALPDGQGAPVAGLKTVAQRNWEGSAKGIYFVAASKPARLEFFNFSNQHVTRIRDLAAASNSVYRGLSVNPDGRTMLYLQREQARTNVMVASNFH